MQSYSDQPMPLEQPAARGGINEFQSIKFYLDKKKSQKNLTSKFGPVTKRSTGRAKGESRPRASKQIFKRVERAVFKFSRGSDSGSQAQPSEPTSSKRGNSKYLSPKLKRTSSSIQHHNKNNFIHLWCSSACKVLKNCRT